MAKIQLIRSATLKIQYAGSTILIDPMLGAKGSFESYGGVENNPTKNLPVELDTILEGVDFVLISHLHKDHFDDKAKDLLDKSLPIICQPGDKDKIQEEGFINVQELNNSVEINGTEIIRTGGNHGRGPIEKLMGNVSGFILRAEDEPTIYIIGDSIFNDKVKSAIDVYEPDTIITNSGGAFIPGYHENLILLDEEETLDIASYSKNGKIIAVHLEALDHCTVSRASLKRALLRSEIDPERVQIPLDGEIVEI